MAFDKNKGLIRVGSGSSAVTIPLKYIKAESYQATKSITDLDSYRDSNGELHRNALSHLNYKIEFNTRAMLTNTEMTTFMNLFYSRFTTPGERKLYIEAYMPETDSYITGYAYMPDITYTIYSVIESEIRYNATRVAFITY